MTISPKLIRLGSLTYQPVSPQLLSLTNPQLLSLSYRAMRGQYILLGLALAIGGLDLLNIFTTDGSKTGSKEDVRWPPELSELHY